MPAQESTDRLCPACFKTHDGGGACPHCDWRPGSAPENPMYLTPGTQVGDSYLVGGVLGRGGFGITYIGWDRELNTRIAIKEFLPDRIASRGVGHSQVTIYSGQEEAFEYGLTKFREEAQALAKFQQHPGIVSVYRFLRANGTGYMVMEYIDGITLKQYLEQQGGKIPWQQAISIMTPIMDALRAVHRVGILHRDVAPDNIFITHDRRIKLLDFGAARQAIGEQSSSLAVVLKEGYAPEEQYRKKGNQGAWTDVYCVAATLYRSIAGERPPESLDRIHEDDLAPPTQRGASLPAESETALMKGLAVYARDRWQSMREMQRALLGKVAAPPPPEPTPEPVPERKSTGGRSGSVIVALLAFIAVAGGLWFYQDNGKQEIAREQAKLDRATFELAQQAGDPEAYQRYLSNCAPYGCGYSAEAHRLQSELASQHQQHNRQQQDAQRYQSARAEDTESAYAQYLGRCEPNGCGYREEAQRRVAQLRSERQESERRSNDRAAFQTAQTRNTEESYREYLASCSANGCAYRDEANTTLTRLRRDREADEKRARDIAAYQRARSRGTEQGYRDYLENCSTYGCRFQQEARIALSALQEQAQCQDGYLHEAQIRQLVSGKTAFGRRTHSSDRSSWKEYQGSNGTAYFQKEGKDYISGRWKTESDRICWCYGSCTSYQCKRIRAASNCSTWYYEDPDTRESTGRVLRWENGDKTG